MQKPNIAGNGGWCRAKGYGEGKEEDLKAIQLVNLKGNYFGSTKDMPDPVFGGKHSLKYGMSVAAVVRVPDGPTGRRGGDSIEVSDVWHSETIAEGKSW